MNDQDTHESTEDFIFTTVDIAKLHNGKERHMTQRTIIEGTPPQDFAMFIIRVTIPWDNGRLSGDFPVTGAKTPQGAFDLYDKTITNAINTIKAEATKQATKIIAPHNGSGRVGRL